jgi:hypothetical protein
MDRPVATLPLSQSLLSAGLPFFAAVVEGWRERPILGWSMLTFSAATSTLLPYQNTRFQTRVAEAGTRLSEWTLNPWRKLSLLVLTFLLSFLIGVGLGSITGALDLLDLVAAVLCVLVLELSVRGRGVLRRSKGDRLPLHLIDMARMGLLYGLLLEGFKLL